VADLVHFKILHVDDEPAFLDIVKLFLEQTGDIAVDCALSVDEAEKYLVQSEYDAIISDYQMPGVSGIEFLKRLRSRGDLIPFILFTGRGREEVVIEALNSGTDYYMQKGGAPDVVFAKLASCVRQGAHRYRAEKARQEGENHLRSMVDSFFEGVGVHVNRVLIEANHSFCQMTGYERDELIGMSMENLYTKQSWKVIVENLGHPVAKPYMVQAVRKDGSIMNFKAEGKNVTWNGQITRFSTMFGPTALNVARVGAMSGEPTVECRRVFPGYCVEER
jgi:PAS domain S-box-containing protein